MAGTGIAPIVELRLILDSPAEGPRNMAVDEVLLHDAAENGIATLRFYQWSEPTLSLGYFQHVIDRCQHAASRDCAIVRRQTGGGAILHDRELTYSMALPPAHPLARTPIRLYEGVHDALIAALQDWLRPGEHTWAIERLTNVPAAARQPDPFLCFQRRSNGDVLLVRRTSGNPLCRFDATAGEHRTFKLIGSAQRRFRGAILQHGSLLLEQSAFAPELAGWLNLVGTRLPADELADVLAEKIGLVLGGRPHPTPLLAEQEHDANRLATAKYGSSEWLNRR